MSIVLAGLLDVVDASKKKGICVLEDCSFVAVHFNIQQGHFIDIES